MTVQAAVPVPLLGSATRFAELMCLWWCMHRAVVLISPCKMSGLSYLSVPTWQPCQLQQRPLQGPHASLVLPG